MHILPMRSLAFSVHCLALVTFGLAGRTATAAPECPYEATVRTTEVEVRSGPGLRYYVTGRVRQSERVTVQRHDPGGWFMIAPPAGSFSYVDAAYVQRTGDAAGVVQIPPLETGDAARAIVRIGSEFGDDHSYYGRELANGDEVQILGEKTLQTDRGAVRMYKIAPPSLEYRWVKGDFIVPAGVETPPATTVDPFARTTAPAVESAPVTAAAAAVLSTATVPPSVPATALPTARPPIVTATGDHKDVMTQLDLRYIELLQQSPDKWDLDGLVSDYQALRPVATAEMAEQIDERLAALESRRKFWNDYHDFVRLTAETSQRDAELVALQNGGIQPAVATDAATPVIQQTGGTMVETPEPTIDPPALLQQQPLTTTPSTIPATEPMVTPQFDGAGIVQRMPSGRRGQFVHVLADSQGRVLALLQAPPQMNLDAYVGQSLGVIGQRYFDPRMRADVINVRQISPVQLAR